MFTSHLWVHHGGSQRCDESTVCRVCECMQCEENNTVCTVPIRIICSHTHKAHRIFITLQTCNDNPGWGCLWHLLPRPSLVPCCLCSPSLCAIRDSLQRNVTNPWYSKTTNLLQLGGALVPHWVVRVVPPPWPFRSPR